MKRILIIGLLSIALVLTIQAQELYTKKNLEKASMEELDIYLKKAQKKKKNASILFIAGPSSIVIGTGLILLDYQSSYISPGLVIGACLLTSGAIVTIFAIPEYFLGSTRIKRINNIKIRSSEEVYIELSPCSFNNYMTQNHQNGVTLRIRF